MSFESPVISIKSYGYVKAESYFDTRQVIGAGENQGLLFPAPYVPDIFGRDIDAHGQFTMSCIETRAGLIFNTPEVCGIKTSGVLESDCYGLLPIPPLILLMCLKHGAYIMLWRK